MAVGLLFFIRLMLTACLAAGQQLTETCMTDSYRAECPDGQVVVMERAEYGRMASGRCITAEYGSVGCENDVIELLDSWCSGQRDCEFYTMGLHKANKQCSKDLILYLRSSYSCVTVIRRPFSYCTSHDNVELSEVDGFLASQVTEETGCGNPRVPWLIRAKPGQTIDITMMDFGVISNEKVRDQACVVYGYIIEQTSGVNQTICGSGRRKQHVYTSKSSTVQIVVLPSQMRKQQSRDNRFLLHYQTKGCPDLSPPAHSVYKRQGNTATIECTVGGRSWDLVCDEQGWKGVVGNCSALVAASQEKSSMPMSTVLMLGGVIGATVLISIVILTLGLCYLKKIRPKRQRKRHKRKEKEQKSSKEETPLEPYLLKPSQAPEVKMRPGHFRPMSYGGASAMGLGYAPGIPVDYPLAANRSSISSGYRYSSSTMYAQIIDELPHPDGEGAKIQEKNTNTGPARLPGHHRQMSLQLAHNRTPSWSFRHSRQPSMPYGHIRQLSNASTGGYDRVILAQSPGGTKVLIHQAAENDSLPAPPDESPEPENSPPKLPPRGQKPGTSPRPEEAVGKATRPATFETVPPRSSFVEVDNSGGYYSPSTGHKYYVLEQRPMLLDNPRN